MADRSFGQLLGELILQKRRAAGLTQLQLAEDAFGSTAKTRRISELENGTVANPHLKTIDPIIVTLGISTAEVELCAKQARAKPDDDLDRAYREARNLIDAIARQFEHAQPNATLAELDEFLREKASEWALLRRKIHEIEGSDSELSSLKAAAEAALSNGNFDEVDALLAKAEENYQQERTLREVRKHAAIRITRGDNSLLRGDAIEAFAFYKSGVEFFRAFDQIEMASNIDAIARRIYETGRRSLQPTFFIAADLLKILIELEHVKTNPRSLAGACYRLGLVYRNEYENNPSEAASEALDNAIKYSAIAAAYVGTKEDLFQIISAKVGLANCLMDRAKASHSRDDIRKAIELLNSSKFALKENPDAEALSPHVLNSLGAALMAWRQIDKSENAEEVLDDAFKAFSDAVRAAEDFSDVEVWGASKANIGGILAEKANARDPEDPDGQFLRIRAISELSAAIETFPVVVFPFKFGEAKFSLGRVLMEHALALQSPLSEIYLFRAIQAYEAAANVFSEETYPERWARIQSYIGSIFSIHAKMIDGDTVLNDYETAIQLYERASEVFKSLNLSKDRCVIA